MDTNKKKTILITGILVTIFALAFATYALWRKTYKQGDNNQIGTACLDVERVSEQGDIIAVDAVPPENNNEGANNTTPYIMKVRNNCDNPVGIVGVLEKIKDSSVTNNSDYLDSKYIQVNTSSLQRSVGVLEAFTTFDMYPLMDNEESSVLETRKIFSSVLAPGETRNVVLKLWIDADTPLRDENGSNSGKKFFARLVIKTGQGDGQEYYALTDESCFNINASTGFIQSYNASCGDILVLPPVVNGVQVKGISLTNSFSYADISQAIYLESVNLPNVINFFNTMKMPDSLLRIPQDGLSGYRGRNIILNEGLTRIYEEGLYNYEGYYQDLFIPSSVTQIDSRAFFAYKGSSVTFGGPTAVGTEAFRNFRGEGSSLTVKGNVSSGAFYAFYGDNLTIAEGVTAIGSTAFRTYNGSTLILPSTLNRIGSLAFENYNGSDVTIPASVVRIGERAFDSLGSDKTVYIEMTQADFNANVKICSTSSADTSCYTPGTYSWYGNATLHFLDS